MEKNNASAAKKRMLSLYILEALRTHSDKEHRLTRQRIIDIIKANHGIEFERKAVSNNILDLIELGYNIDDDKSRGCYLDEHDFDDSELRLLIDSLIFYKNIPSSQCTALINKLKKLSSSHFSARIGHIRSLSDNRPQNKQLFYTIEILDEALSKGRQVAFVYNSFGPDKKLHPRRSEKYVVNPYQIVATNGRYYLICNYDKYDSIANYRIDRITDIELLETRAKPLSELEGYSGGLDLPKHMAEHIYMFSGEAIDVVFRVDSKRVGDVIDWFGKNAQFSNITDTTCDVSVRVNEEAMLYWSLQYGSYMEVLSPNSLRKRVREAALNIAKKYE